MNTMLDYFVVGLGAGMVLVLLVAWICMLVEGICMIVDDREHGGPAD